MMQTILKKNNNYFNHSHVPFDGNSYSGIRKCLEEKGFAIFNTSISEKIIDKINNKITNLVANNDNTQLVIYSRDQKNRLKSSLNKSSNLYKEIESCFQPLLNILAQEFNRKVSILKINSDIALSGSNLQYPHWDNEQKNRKYFLTVPLVQMDRNNGSLEIWPCTNGLDKHIDKSKKLNNTKYTLVNMQYKNTFTEVTDMLDKLKSCIGPFYKSQVIIRDNSTLHRGTINQSDKIRSTLTIVLDI